MVDGDTIRIRLPDNPKDTTLRLLCLDTEESYSGGTKPVTPWGKAAKSHTEDFFRDATEVTLEFPGSEPIDECLEKYRGNYGRLLVYVWHKRILFQEHMIQAGYSPCFNKFGNAKFPGYHERFQQAERKAQADNLGVWDQYEVNGTIRRNYAALGTWWQLRARTIDAYRRARKFNPCLLNTRLDYSVLVSQAEKEGSVTIFTELHSLRRTGRRGAVLGIGSNHQPFSLYLRDVDSITGQNAVNLLMNRYITMGEDTRRRSYAYVTGQLQTYDGKPQMVLESPWQITDTPPESPVPHIHSVLPNPEGSDRGNETITVRNPSCGSISLDNWSVQDAAGAMDTLSGILPANSTHTFRLKKVRLNNDGDTLQLLDPEGHALHSISYTADDVQEGQPIHFEAPGEGG